ncbi:TonB family protein [Nitrospirota bacterium]
MSYQSRAFVYSGSIHLIAATLVIASSVLSMPIEHRSGIDLSILDTVKTAGVTAKASVKKSIKKTEEPRVIKKPVAKMLPEKIFPPRERSPEPTLEARVIKIEQESIAEEDTNENTQEIIADTTEPRQTDIIPSIGPEKAAPAPPPDYSYVRNIVQNNITYPSIARRTGVEGKVMIAFTINCDGTIKDIEVVKGSGNIILDKNAINAVKKTTRFPIQDKEARVIIPIVYKLYDKS